MESDYSIRDAAMKEYSVFNIMRCTVIRETEAAVQIMLSTGNKVWIPLSQVEEIHKDPGKFEQDSLVVTRWIAEQKGLT